MNLNIFMALKNWIYGGFKKLSKLFRRVVSSMGQKLPNNWKEKYACIVCCTVNAEMPRQREDGTFQPGVTDDKMGNTDQVPVYVESRGNYQWGRREDHHRRMVSTAGKENNRFIVQLTVFKYGRKVRSVSYKTHYYSVTNTAVSYLMLIFLLYSYCFEGNPIYYLQSCACS